MANDTSEIEICFKFKKHFRSKYQNAHSALSDAFGTYIDIDTLYADDTEGKSTLIADPLTEIRRQVSEIIYRDSIIDDEADEITIQNEIKRKVDKMHLNSRLKNGTLITFRSANDFKRAFNKMDGEPLILLMSIDQLHFKDEFLAINPTEWGINDNPEWHNDDSPQPTSPMPAQTQNQLLIEQAVQATINRISPNRSPKEEEHRAQAPIESTTFFNHAALPAEVQARYLAKK